MPDWGATFAIDATSVLALAPLPIESALRYLDHCLLFHRNAILEYMEFRLSTVRVSALRFLRCRAPKRLRVARTASFCVSRGRTKVYRRRLTRSSIDLFQTSCCPRRCPSGIFEVFVCNSRQTKTPHLQGFRGIAGAGFEPATFGL